jgi:hypothetical protein
LAELTYINKVSQSFTLGLLGPFLEIEADSVSACVEQHSLEEAIFVISFGGSQSQGMQIDGQSSLDESLKDVSHLEGSIVLVLLILFILSQSILLPLLENSLEVKKP